MPACFLKSRLFKIMRHSLAHLLIAATLVCVHPLFAQTFRLKTANLAITFQVGSDGRLYQQPIGVTDTAAKLPRDDEFYPQAGDGYVWEPALQVVHADGNTSTDLLFVRRDPNQRNRRTLP